MGLHVEYRLRAERRAYQLRGREPLEFFVTEAEWDALITMLDRFATGFDEPVGGANRMIYMGVPVAGITSEGQIFRQKPIELSRAGKKIRLLASPNVGRSHEDAGAGSPQSGSVHE